jgi:hypothetical protein
MRGVLTTSFSLTYIVDGDMTGTLGETCPILKLRNPLRKKPFVEGICLMTCFTDAALSTRGNT